MAGCVLFSALRYQIWISTRIKGWKGIDATGKHIVNGSFRILPCNKLISFACLRTYPFPFPFLRNLYEHYSKKLVSKEPSEFLYSFG